MIRARCRVKISLLQALLFFGLEGLHFFCYLGKDFLFAGGSLLANTSNGIGSVLVCTILSVVRFERLLVGFTIDAMHCVVERLRRSNWVFKIQMLLRNVLTHNSPSNACEVA